MKTLELKLKKDVIIVQPEETGNINYWVTIYSDEWEFICLGSELTEEIASELVDEGSYFKTFKNYITNDNHKRNQLKFAIESFISAVESKGFYWLENPISRPRNYELWSKYGDYTQYGIVLTEKCLKWQGAEEKTFKNPLIFVKK